jgi:hypothetical protein
LSKVVGGADSVGRRTALANSGMDMDNPSVDTGD